MVVIGSNHLGSKDNIDINSTGINSNGKSFATLLKNKVKRIGHRFAAIQNDRCLAPADLSESEFFTADYTSDACVVTSSTKLSRSPVSPSTAESSLWEASLSLKASLRRDNERDANDILFEKIKSSQINEVKLFSQDDDFFDVNVINSVIQKKLQKCVFQMYCATVQCTICLSNLSSNGMPNKYVVKASIGSDLKPKLTFCININDNTKDNAIDLNLVDEEALLSVACLPCGHKFCHTCMQSLIEHKAETTHGSMEQAPLKMRIRCPLCRRKVKVTSVSYFTV